MSDTTEIPEIFTSAPLTKDEAERLAEKIRANTDVFDVKIVEGEREPFYEVNLCLKNTTQILPKEGVVQGEFWQRLKALEEKAKTHPWVKISVEYRELGEEKGIYLTTNLGEDRQQTEDFLCPVIMYDKRTNTPITGYNNNEDALYSLMGFAYWEDEPVHAIQVHVDFIRNLEFALREHQDDHSQPADPTSGPGSTDQTPHGGN